MLYRENPKNGDKLSQLGYGCMRFPRKNGAVDIAKTTGLVKHAVENGINYFDTAYLYPGNEAALGRALSGIGREKVKIATKLPLFFTRSAADFDKFFNKQLERLQTGYIDYYMLHMLTSFEQYENFKRMGIFDWALDKKKKGEIKNFGFSFHGVSNAFAEIIDAFGWDFCMIQYNYIDENNQAGTAGLKYAAGKGLPVFVMEPLRGGMLAGNLPEEAESAFKKAGPTKSPAEWGLRWVWNHPEVTLLLSGMNTIEQLDGNIKTASEARANVFGEVELAAFEEAKTAVRGRILVPCTGCSYCMPCPSGVNIPGCFNFYNDTAVMKKRRVVFKYLMSNGVLSGKTTYASQCVRCGKCEKHCPQQIKIIDKLAAAANVLEPFWLKPAARVVKAFTVGKTVKTENEKEV